MNHNPEDKLAAAIRNKVLGIGREVLREGGIDDETSTEMLLNIDSELQSRLIPLCDTVKKARPAMKIFRGLVGKLRCDGK